MPGVNETLRQAALKIGRDYGIYAILVVVVIAAILVYPGFLGWPNVSALISQNAALGIVAVGMTFVIIAGGFDLSVGATYAASGTFAAMATNAISYPAGVAVALATGLVAGLANGLIVTKLRVNPFVATLGTSTLFLGIVLIVSNKSPIVVEGASFRFLGQGSLGPIPIPILLLTIIAVVAWICLRLSVYGRRVQAVGGNSEASRLSGVRADLVQGSTYVVAGLCAAIAGLLGASQLGVGQGSAGALIALNAIAVVVIGGTSLMGGEGSIMRTLVGLLILATINNIFFSLAVPSEWQGITQGIIIVAAVAFDQFMRRARSR